MSITALRAAWVGLVLAAVSSATLAASSMREAAPFYTPEHFVRGAYGHWYLPRAVAFLTEARSLAAGARGFCSNEVPREAVRKQWLEAMLAWTRLSTVAVGPLITRKSVRAIDFAPPRPQAIRQAIAVGPSGAAAMELVGGPAKGFAAMEWLLWTEQASPGSPACAYEVELAADIEREATALAAAFTALAEKEWDGESAAAAMSEVVNQWIGAIERLRWTAMEKPLRSAGKAAPDYPRAVAGASSASWRAQWEAIEAIGAGGGATPPPGTAIVPLAAYLRGRGLNPAADALVAATRAAGARIVAADPKRPATVTAAARELAALKRTAEGRVAPALKVQIGFSDADGD